ncbi:MAG: hypothetical protein AB1540_07860, partial [Bdellovibrionota bacterium]
VVMRRFWGNHRGSMLVESVMAGLLLSVAILAVAPAFFQGKLNSKIIDFQQICMSAVQAKLNEYRYGSRVSIGANPNRITHANAGINGLGGSATGFAYAKLRYNWQKYRYCPSHFGPTGTAPREVSSLPPVFFMEHLGREECFSGVGNEPETYPPGIATCPSAIDQRLRTDIPNMRIFVNLRRYNTVINPAGPVEDCPGHVLSAPVNLGTDSLGITYMSEDNQVYDFHMAGDMIKVTVTALVDIPTGQQYAGIYKDDAREELLTCQVSDYLKPHTHPARYWLSKDDGRIYKWVGVGADNNHEVFSNLRVPGAIGLLVSPDDRWVFILKPGRLIQYRNCGVEADQPLNCPLGVAPIEWDIDPKVDVIFAKFTGSTPHVPNPICTAPNFFDGLPVIFGLHSDRRTASCIQLPVGGGNAMVNNAGVIPFRVPVLGGGERIKSGFMDPTGSNVYFVDSTCSDQLITNGGITASKYCGGIYHSNDMNMAYPIDIFNVNAVAFSP